MKNVLEYLEATAGALPEKTAAVDELGAVSFRELRQTAERIGSALLTRLSGTRQPVPVLMEKGVAALECFFGAVYAGCFYTLLNPALPAARLSQQLGVLTPELLLTDRAHAAQAATLTESGKIVLLEDIAAAPENPAALARVRAAMTDADPLYANFTSGSTGTPKGVLVGHRSVIDFIDVFTELFGFGSGDVIANQAPFDFDVSVKDIYTALKTGATLVIVPKHLFSQPTQLLDFLCAHQVTALIWAVSALCLISTFHGLDYKTPDTVRHVLFSGEVMPEKHLLQWMAHLPEAEFVNLYGPTEITCNCTYHRIDRARDYGHRIPAGEAFPNERVFLLDEQNQLVTAAEAPGEICVAGACLALGYYRDPAQTDAHFVQNPLNADFPERIYRTGDLGCWNERGELLFLGRKDFQIKYMGHRIELEEIEAAMMKLPGVERACALFDPEKEKLYGFYVGSLSKAELFQQLSERLPEFMVPRALRQVEEMPMTKNGKIDRKELLARAKTKTTAAAGK